MKIYTKTGDKGKTSLFSGGRVNKSDLRIKAYGTTDELNSFIGMLRAYKIKESHKKTLLQIQNKLYNLGSIIAVKEKTSFKIPELKQEDIKLLEKEIDKLNKTLPILKDFIIPGGNTQTSQCHICRSICRRAERELVELAINENIDNLLIKYLNRLSDYLFVLSRAISKESNAEEIIWKP